MKNLTFLIAACVLASSLGRAVLAEESAGNAALAAKIDRLAEQLQSPKYRQREAATRELWRCGLAARDRLLELAQHGDVETRLRAGGILKDFDYGILPSIPEVDQQTIIEFRDGKLQQRSIAFQRLCDARNLQVLTRLVAMEQQPSERLRWLQVMFQSVEVATESRAWNKSIDWSTK